MKSGRTPCQNCSTLFASHAKVSGLMTKSYYDADKLIVSRELDDIRHRAAEGCPLCMMVMQGYAKFESGQSEGWTFDSTQKNVDLLFRLVKLDKGYDPRQDHLDLTLDHEGLIRKLVELQSPEDKKLGLKDVNFLSISVSQLETNIELSSTWQMIVPASPEWFSLGQVSLSASSDPAAKLIKSRPRLKNVRSSHAFTLIKEKVYQCLACHELCPGETVHSLPLRVIDVGTPIDCDTLPRLVEAPGKRAHYIALSYRWGMKRQPVMATTENIHELKEALPVAKLPLTIRDAIFVTKQLGIRYLWIDSLCIIQNSKHDKETQISQMQHIFSNAYLTISAASAENCNHGFLQERSFTQRKESGAYTRDPGTGELTEVTAMPSFKNFEDFELPLRCPDGTIGTVIIQANDEFDPDLQPVNSRAWTLEERLLSPRLLVYGTSQLVWQCQSGQLTFESHEETLPNDVAGNLRLDELLLHPANIPHPLPKRLSYKLRMSWCDLIDNYTARELSDSRDRLRAISGIAARFQLAYKDQRYVAGLWYTEGVARGYLLMQLLWRKFPLQRRAVDPDDLAPSWSWVSVDGNIKWRHADDVASDSPSEVIDCAVEPFSIINIFGRVKWGTLTLKGPIRRVRGRIELSKNMWGELMGLRLTLISVENADDDFYGEISHASDEQVDSVVEVSLLHVTEQSGLILLDASNGNFKRIGMFLFDSNFRKGYGEQEAAAKGRDFFSESNKKMVTII